VNKSWRAIVIDVPAVLAHYQKLHGQMRRGLHEEIRHGGPWDARRARKLQVGSDIQRFSGRAVQEAQNDAQPGWRDRDWAKGWRCSTFEAVMAHVNAGRWLAVRLAIPTLPKNSPDWIDLIFTALERRAPEQHVKAMVLQYHPMKRVTWDGKFAASILQSGDVNLIREVAAGIKANLNDAYYWRDDSGVMRKWDDMGVPIRSMVAAIRHHLKAAKST
jgi:hypothetical protein